MKQIEPEVSPVGWDYLQVYISDYMQEEWYMVVNVDQDNIDEVLEAVNAANEADRDVYYLVQDHGGNTAGLYEFINENDDPMLVFNEDLWNIWASKGDDHLSMYLEVSGYTTMEYLEDFEYTVYDSVYDFMEEFHEELYRALRSANAMDFFDFNEFIEDDGEVEILSNGKVVSYSM